jgi:hypothetical protein
MVKKVTLFESIYSLGQISQIVSNYPNKKALLKDIVTTLKAFNMQEAIKNKAQTVANNKKATKKKNTYTPSAPGCSGNQPSSATC